MPGGHDYYEVLQVSPNADEDVIQAAYKRLTSKWHPDRNHGDPSAAARTQRLNEAYEVLSDRAKRREYDLRRGRSATSGGIVGEPTEAIAKVQQSPAVRS